MEDHALDHSSDGDAEQIVAGEPRLRVLHQVFILSACRYSRGHLNSGVMPLLFKYSPMHKSLATVVALLFLAGASTVCAQDKRIGTFQFEKKGSHTAKVIFQTRAFDRSKHTVEYGNFHNRVDGRVAYGAESVPSAEISSVKFFFDGRRIRVPRRLYSDCYNPNFDSPMFIKMRFSRDLQSVIISMAGADGAGGYEVIWRLRKNGKHSRSVSEGL